jgi:Uma2 family endonuclease
MIQDVITEQVTKKLFTVDEFQRMSDAGILPENGRFELIRGEIIEMPLPGSPHSSRVKRLNRLFTSRLGDSVIVSVQDPFIIDLYTDPFPDVALLRPRDDFYEAAHPGPEDVLLVVEVSHHSASYDKNVKAPLYAEAKVPEYWQVDVIKELVTVRTDPKENEYQTVRTFGRGETIRSGQLRDVAFSVDEILGTKQPAGTLPLSEPTDDD